MGAADRGGHRRPPGTRHGRMTARRPPRVSPRRSRPGDVGRLRGRGGPPARPAASPSTRRRGSGTAARSVRCQRRWAPGERSVRSASIATVIPSASRPSTANRDGRFERGHPGVERGGPAGDPLRDPQASAHRQWRGVGRVGARDRDHAARDEPLGPPLDGDELGEDVGRRSGRVDRDLEVDGHRSGPHDGAEPERRSAPEVLGRRPVAEDQPADRPDVVVPAERLGDRVELPLTDDHATGRVGQQVPGPVGAPRSVRRRGGCRRDRRDSRRRPPAAPGTVGRS